MNEVKMKVNLGCLKNIRTFTAKDGQEYLAIPIQSNNVAVKQRPNNNKGYYITFDVEKSDDTFWVKQDGNIIGWLKQDMVATILKENPLIKELAEIFECKVTITEI